jgi:hypothetical protein
LKTNEQMHRELWGELARTGGLNKHGIRIALGLPHQLNDCFACAECEATCMLCPIIWNNEYGDDGEAGCCQSYFSPYAWWREEESPEVRKRYAYHISKMEWNE